MEHTLLLSVPEEVYQSLLDEAEQTGQPLEALAVQRLVVGARSHVTDPLDDLIGSMESDIPDWSSNHDWYIGQAILESMQEHKSVDGPGDA